MVDIDRRTLTRVRDFCDAVLKAKAQEELQDLIRRKGEEMGITPEDLEKVSKLCFAVARDRRERAHNITITVSEELWSVMRRWKGRLPVSKICQEALAKEVAKLETLPKEMLEMSVELVCDGCGKRLKQSSSWMIPLGSQEWAEIEVRPPRKIQKEEKVGGIICVSLNLRYTVCSAQCAHKILDRIVKELDDAFKSAASPAAK